MAVRFSTGAAIEAGIRTPTLRTRFGGKSIPENEREASDSRLPSRLSEENRAEKLLEKAGELSKKPCFFWSATGGYYNTNKFGKDADPLNALNTIMDYAEPGLFILKDFHPFLEDPVTIRKIRDIVANLKKSYKTLFIILHYLSPFK